MSSSRIAYLPEVEGLRAIAVISVLLYHANLGLGAGFVGVDIFFVISGYLITALLVKEWSEAAHIDFLDFYIRRLRRLLPAMLVVIIFVVACSMWLIPTPEELRQVAESAAYSLIFLANHYFVTVTGGYFDAPVELMPLIHLWSLAVEGQFYLVWPLILWLALISTKGKVLWVIAILSGISLLVSQWLLLKNPELSFYLMPSRFWELAAGSMIALLPERKLSKGFPWALGGVVLLVLALLLSPSDQFPAVGALPVVLGTALLLLTIHWRGDLGWIGKGLRSKPLVFVGRISYSLYLWHWPLLALDRATRVGESPLAVRLGLCIAAVVIAWLSYRYIEQPFRRQRPGQSARKLAGVTAAATVVFALGFYSLGNTLSVAHLLNDLATKTAQDRPANMDTCHFDVGESLERFPPVECLSRADRPVEVVLWGDSMAFAWQPLAWSLGESLNVASVTYSRNGCPPILGFVNYETPADVALCKHFNQLVVDELTDNVRTIHTLVLSAMWSGLLNSSRSRDEQLRFAQGLADTLQQLSPRVQRIIVLGPTPRLRDSVPRCIRNGAVDACQINRQVFEGQSHMVRDFLMSLAGNFDNVTYLEPANFFCTAEVCLAFKEGYGLYWDSYHVTATAARRFAQQHLSELTSGTSGGL